MLAVADSFVNLRVLLLPEFVVRDTAHIGPEGKFFPGTHRYSQPPEIACEIFVNLHYLRCCIL
jgi:hypothetical protein